MTSLSADDPAAPDLLAAPPPEPLDARDDGEDHPALALLPRWGSVSREVYELAFARYLAQLAGAPPEIESRPGDPEPVGVAETRAILGGYLESAERPWPAPRSKVDPASALVDAWLIDGVLRPGRMMVLASAEGVGKSRVRLEASIRLATRHGALFNHYRIPAPCRVVSFDVENGEEEETRREEDVLARLGLVRGDLADYWGVSLEGLSLTDPADQAYIRTALERSSPAVAFFDTGSSMVGEEWGPELKAAVRFLRGLAREYGCAIVVLVHLVKPARPARDGKGQRKPDEGGQHGTSLADVMGQWTRQADTVALLAPAGAERILWTVRKRAPHSQLVLHAEGGTFDVLQIVAGEDLGIGTMERVHGCVATGYADVASIATYLEIHERTVWRHVAKLREAGRLAADAPLRLSARVSGPASDVSRGPQPRSSAPVSDMPAGPTDTVTHPLGGDSRSVSVSPGAMGEPGEPEPTPEPLVPDAPDGGAPTGSEQPTSHGPNGADIVAQLEAAFAALGGGSQLVHDLADTAGVPVEEAYRALRRDAGRTFVEVPGRDAGEVERWALAASLDEPAEGAAVRWF